MRPGGVPRHAGSSPGTQPWLHHVRLGSLRSHSSHLSLSSCRFGKQHYLHKAWFLGFKEETYLKNLAEVWHVVGGALRLTESLSTCQWCARAALHWLVRADHVHASPSSALSDISLPAQNWLRWGVPMPQKSANATNRIKWGFFPRWRAGGNPSRGPSDPQGAQREAGQSWSARCAKRPSTPSPRVLGAWEDCMWS